MKVYMVQFDWSTQDDSGIEIELFDTYTKSFDRFNEIIANEHNADLSWAAEAFDENGDVKDGYELNEHIETDGTQEFDCWWNLADTNDWNTHDFIDLKIMEVQS